MNQLLSQRRAASVVEFLTQGYSIAPDRLEAVGYGEAQLADQLTRLAARTGGLNSYRLNQISGRQAHLSPIVALATRRARNERVTHFCNCNASLGEISPWFSA